MLKGDTRKVLTRRILTRKVLNLNNTAESGPDSPPQAKGIGNIALNRVVRLGWVRLGW